MFALTRFGLSDYEKQARTHMLSVPERLRAVAHDLLRRVRLGLDLPSRQEVLSLADRIEALGQQLQML